MNFIKIFGGIIIFSLFLWGIYCSYKEDIKFRIGFFILLFGLFMSSFIILTFFVQSEITGKPRGWLLDVILMNKTSFGGIALPISYGVISFGISSLIMSCLKIAMRKIKNSVKKFSDNS